MEMALPLMPLSRPLKVRPENPVPRLPVLRLAGARLAFPPTPGDSGIPPRHARHCYLSRPIAECRRYGGDRVLLSARCRGEDTSNRERPVEARKPVTVAIIGFINVRKLPALLVRTKKAPPFF